MHTPPFKARGYRRLRTCADPGSWGAEGTGRSPPRTRRPAFVPAAAQTDPSRELPRYLRAASASMAAPPRVRPLLPSPRAPALPLGARTHHRIGAAGGRMALASAPPTLLHHRGESPAHFRPPPRRPEASPSRDAGQANGVSLLGRPDRRFAFRETWSWERMGSARLTSAFVGSKFPCRCGLRVMVFRMCYAWWQIHVFSPQILCGLKATCLGAHRA